VTSQFPICFEYSFSPVDGDDVHIVSTFPAKNAEIFAIIHGLIVYLHPKSYSTCNLQSIYSMPRFVNYQMSHKDIYGELMADISTSPDAQPFKYGGKVPNRTIDNQSLPNRIMEWPVEIWIHY